MHDGMTQIGGIMRNAREAKELTQAALAERIGVSVRTIIAVEKIRGILHTMCSIDLSTRWIFLPT